MRSIKEDDHLKQAVASATQFSMFTAFCYKEGEVDAYSEHAA